MGRGGLCIFARAPERGRVKTRIARALGEATALAAHERLVSNTLQRLARVPGMRSELWIAGPADHPGVRRWAQNSGLPVRQQRGGDLGARMLHAVEQCLAAGPFGMVVGTDCPTITAPYVTEAARQLEQCAMVLGPAEDGGYGLIGLSRSAPELFLDMSWGSDAVLDETLARAQRLGISYRLLEVVWDVDEPSDWNRYLAMCESS